MVVKNFQQNYSPDVLMNKFDYILGGYPLSTYPKFSEKTNISKPLIRARMCA